MKVTVEKYPIPLIWLDTSIFIKLGKIDAGTKLQKQEVERLKQLRDTISQKIKARRTICVESDQYEEVEIGKKFLDPIRSAMVLATSGIKLHHRLHIEEFQTYRAMEAYVSGKTEFDLPCEDIFHRDPAKELAEQERFPFLIDVKMPRPNQMLKERLRQKQNLMKTFEDLRCEAVAKKITFQKQKEMEENGMASTFRNCVFEYMHRRIAGEPPTVQEILNLYDLIESLLYYWRILNNKQETLDELQEFIRFFVSDHYKACPFVDIRSTLYADMLTGSAKIKQGDYMDVQQLAAVLPYCNIVVTDRQMRGRIRRHGLDKKYNTTVYAMNDFIELIKHLNGL